MLRPNIWAKKTEKLVCRSGWLRLSAARTRSDWSKTFPGQFFENGRVEEEEGRGRQLSQRIVANSGHDRICVPQTHSVKIVPTQTTRLSHKEYSLCVF